MHTILFINYTSIKLQIEKFTKRPLLENGIVSVVEDAHQRYASAFLFQPLQWRMPMEEVLDDSVDTATKKPKPQEKRCSNSKKFLWSCHADWRCAVLKF